MRALIIILLVAFTTTAYAKPLRIAVASNFLPALEGIVASYQVHNSAEITVSSAATGVLYAQITNGAPYDVFLAADLVRPNLLLKTDRALTEPVTDYAFGRLAWLMHKADVNDCNLALDRALQFQDASISIANPQTAPYGAVAVQWLKQNVPSYDWQSKLVYAGNAAQALSYFASGASRATLGSLALIQRWHAMQPSETIVCTIEDHAPIGQRGVILKNSRNIDQAKHFLAYVTTPEVQRSLAGQGYQHMPRPRRLNHE